MVSISNVFTFNSEKITDTSIELSIENEYHSPPYADNASEYDAPPLSNVNSANSISEFDSNYIIPPRSALDDSLETEYCAPPIEIEHEYVAPPVTH